jgi:nicotinate-nucleotide--dimethylbenzimidazole phosphoribosyltransferase
MNNFEDWLKSPVASLNSTASEQAFQRQQQLTKPAGSLGRLEQVAIELAAMQARSLPQIEKVQITVFAADHGVMAENVSAFPQSVTTAMIRNFANGGAAISVLAKSLNAHLSVINVGSVDQLEVIAGVDDQRIAAGTNNFCLEAAMSAEQLQQALSIGADHVTEKLEQGLDLFIGGDMGIGNTTSASAIACALLELPAETLTGPGTGLNSDGVKHKASVIDKALLKHQSVLNNPLLVLQHLGGFEIAAVTGAYLACAKHGVPVMVDGFISSVAALAAERLCPGSRDWFIYSHASAEPGHQPIMAALDAHPLLDLGMRLGEASGAAVAVPLLKLSCALHANMATFEQAAVAGAL